MKGFTLLELLIVLMIIGLLGTIAIPRVKLMYEAGEFSFERDDLVRQIASLGYQAHVNRTRLVLADTTAADETPLELPEGWRVRVEKPLVFHANGVCEGGVVHLEKGQRAVSLKLEAPYCQPQRI